MATSRIAARRISRQRPRARQGRLAVFSNRYDQARAGARRDDGRPQGRPIDRALEPHDLSRPELATIANLIHPIRR